MNNRLDTGHGDYLDPNDLEIDLMTRQVHPTEIGVTSYVRTSQCIDGALAFQARAKHTRRTTDAAHQARHDQLLAAIAKEAARNDPAPVWLGYVLCFALGLGAGVTLISLIK